jgi:hypothetical protein
MYNNDYPNDISNYIRIRSPRYNNTPRHNITSIRSPRYNNTNIIDQNTYPNNYTNTNIIDRNIYPNTSIRSPMYINRNTYSNLPENWSEHISQSGIPYYYDLLTGQSQWQHPTINRQPPETGRQSLVRPQSFSRRPPPLETSRRSLVLPQSFSRRPPPLETSRRSLVLPQSFSRRPPARALPIEDQTPPLETDRRSPL